MGNPPTVDTQIHIWTKDSPIMPVPGWAREFSCNDVLNIINGAKVDMALLVPPHWMEWDNSQALECVRRHPDRFAVVGKMDPAAPDARERFKELTKQPGFVGFRFLFIAKRGSEWLKDGKMRGGPLDWLFGAAEEARIPLAFLFADPLPELAELGLIAADHPKLTLIIDHAAAGGGGQPFSRLPILLELAKHDNIYVKLTGLPPLETDPEKATPFTYMDPVVKAMVDTFGSKRCMWGSDMTKYVGKRTLTEVVDQFRVGCRFLSDEDRAWILGRTAAKVYGLDLATRT